MLKTFSKRDLLWLEDGKGWIYHGVKDPTKNSLKYLWDLGLSVGDEGEGALGVL